jgi:hypothetical protein
VPRRSLALHEMMSMLLRRRNWQVVAASALLLASSHALANGRFPRAQRLREDPTNPNRLALAATYGILTTTDRGRSWYHVCEASFADLASYTGDPLLDFSSDGTLLVGVQSTLNTSRDACQWTAKLGGGETFVVDYTVVRSPESVVALLAQYRNGAVDYELWKSTDRVENWSLLGAVPAESAYTLDVDPADANHIYVTALTDNVGQLLRSRDAGHTWTARRIPNTDVSEPPYLAALHPREPNRLYVRTDSWVPIDGDLTANDALLYSADEGETWTELFRSRAKMLGFALSPDGATVLLGYGDPFAGGAIAVPGPLGIFKSATSAFAFELIFPAHVGCLAWTDRGVYVCASQHFDQFELGFSPDADFSPDAGCITPLLRLSDVKGPLQCPAGTSGVLCDASWIAACAVFGACTDAGTSPAGCAGRGSPVVDAGSVDARAGDALGGPFDARASDGDGVSGIPPASTGSEGGCTCRAAAQKIGGEPAFAGLLPATWVLARRRRRRRA